MCGIAGILSLKGNVRSPERIKRMTDIIQHRGPDGAGFFFSGKEAEAAFIDDEFYRRQKTGNLEAISSSNAKEWMQENRTQLVLGHRRLAIQDLSEAGHQPMTSRSGKNWIVFNGEIYNFKKLREELESDGVQFRSRTDTEVILALYEKEGIAFIKKLDGMFAFSLWDSRRKKLFCVRDRSGIKPFYYYQDEQNFVFGSEIKAVLMSGMVQPKMNLEALNQYLTFQNIFDNQTLFKDIFILEPGHYLEIDLSGVSSVQKVKYWEIHFSKADLVDTVGSAEECAAVLYERFSKSVEQQLIADVPVGAYLSGGIDSSAIVGKASSQISHLHTFTTGFDMAHVTGIEQGFDEREEAEHTASLFRTQHYESVLHSGDMQECLSDLIWHLEDLRAGICYQNYYAAKLASKFVKVCLAGTGGDELFAGYPWRYAAPLASSGVKEFDDASFSLWERLLPFNDRKSFFTEDVWNQIEHQDTRAYFDAAVQSESKDDGLYSKEDLLNRALRFEYKTFLAGLLTIEDRISMAHSLEVRVPFLGHGVIDYACRIPAAFKLSNLGNRRFSKPDNFLMSEGKVILRKAFKGKLPEVILARRKQGFSPPDGNWYRGPSMDYIKEILFDPESLNRSYFKGEMVESILNEHFAGEQNHRLLIWSLLSLEMLSKHYFDRPEAFEFQKDKGTYAEIGR